MEDPYSMLLWLLNKHHSSSIWKAITHCIVLHIWRENSVVIESPPIKS